MMIKKTVFVLSLFLVFASCSTDVDLYADYKDVPVVYGLIDAAADTNYIKITKAFCSDNDHPINANDIALIYDSSNYSYKLDAFFMELKSTQGQPFRPTGRLFYLDTLTIHNKKEGVFYSPHQRLYYTDERFNTNTDHEKYHYKLCIVNTDCDTVTAETSVVGGDISVSAAMVSFKSKPSDAMSSLMFQSTEEAVLYEIGMKFKYREIHDDGPEEIKEVSWSYGTRPLGAFEKVFENTHKMYYSVNTFFNLLESAIGSDTIWDVNHPHVTRYVDDFIISISGAGESFYNYYQFVQAMNSAPSLSADFSNVIGGCGILSSRITVEKSVALSSNTIFDLLNKPWGFQEE